jgi:MarR family transcriptional regulator for hemolysin
MVRIPNLGDTRPHHGAHRRAALVDEFSTLQWELRLRLKASVAARLQHAPAELAAAVSSVTPNQRVVIMAVLQDGQVAMRELARRLSISPSSATELVDRLVNHDWVQRRSDPNDRRAVVIELTPRARSLAQEVRTLVRAGVAELLDPLGESQLSELVATLRLLVASEPSRGQARMDHTTDGGQPT